MTPQNPCNPADSIGELAKSGAYGWKNPEDLLEKVRKHSKERRKSTSSLESGFITHGSRLSKKGEEGKGKKMEIKRIADEAEGKDKDETKNAKKSAVGEDGEAAAEKHTKKNKNPSPPRAMFSDDEEEESPRQPSLQQPVSKHPTIRKEVTRDPIFRKSMSKKPQNEEISPVTHANAEKYLAALLKLREGVESNILKEGRPSKSGAGNCQDKWKQISQQLFQAHRSLIGFVENGMPAEARTPIEALVESRASNIQPTSLDFQPKLLGEHADGSEEYKPISPGKEADEMAKYARTFSKLSQGSPVPGTPASLDHTATVPIGPLEWPTEAAYSPHAPDDQPNVPTYAPTSPSLGLGLPPLEYRPTSPCLGTSLAAPDGEPGAQGYQITSPSFRDDNPACQGYQSTAPGYEAPPSLRAYELAKRLDESLVPVNEAETLELEKMRAGQQDAAEDEVVSVSQAVDEDAARTTEVPASGSSTPDSVFPQMPILEPAVSKSPPSNLPVDEYGDIVASTPGGFLLDCVNIEEASKTVETGTAVDVPMVTVEDANDDSPATRTKKLHDIFDRIDQIRLASQSPQH